MGRTRERRQEEPPMEEQEEIIVYHLSKSSPLRSKLTRVIFKQPLHQDLSREIILSV